MRTMRKNLFLVLLCVFLLLFCFCCTSDSDNLFVDDNLESIENFPNPIKEYGEAFALELREIVINLHKKGIDYSDANASNIFKNRFYKDVYQASSKYNKTKSSVDIFQEQLLRPEVFSQRIKCLTKIQLEFIDKIIMECDKSISYEDLLGRLIDLNKDIYTNVPEIQQERLFTITATLYYGVREIQHLKEQGLMPETPQSYMQRLLVKTRSESGGGTSIGDSCRKFLATTWLIAVGEPTPAGEIVASVATVVVAGVLLYEVIVCKSSSDVDYCIERFKDCVDQPYDRCSTCLKFCIVQGYWPPYETHKCP